MPAAATESSNFHAKRILRGRPLQALSILATTLLTVACTLLSGCRGKSQNTSAAKNDAGKNGGETKSVAQKTAAKETAKGSGTAGISVVHPQRRDIQMMVVQPGTVQAYETTPIYARIAGYVQKYNYNIGDRVKAGDALLNMWIPDYVERLGQFSAEAKRAEVQIRVAESTLRAADAKVETARARVSSAEAGVKRAQASYTRWESESKRLEQLVSQHVLGVQVRDETYRQFKEAIAARDQASAMVSEANSSLTLKPRLHRKFGGASEGATSARVDLRFIA